jgi:hypothetical protein
MRFSQPNTQATAAATQKAFSYIGCTASPTTHLLGLVDILVAGEGKNSL